MSPKMTVREQMQETRVAMEDYLTLEAMVRRYTLDGVRQALEVIKNVHNTWPPVDGTGKVCQVKSTTPTTKVVTRPRLKIVGAAAQTAKQIEFD